MPIDDDGPGWEELFRDSTPIEQNDGPVPVVKIDYSPAFVKVMGYFRRVLVDGEHSQRALVLAAGAQKRFIARWRRNRGHSPFHCVCVCHAAAEVIDHNAANYTAWQFRRKCIRELTKEKSEAEVKAAWQQELAYCTELCIENMKNYQVWFHRRACIDALNEPAGELDFIATVLNEDAKNYHAWGHRQWVLKHFSLWAGELQYVESLIDADLRNNSAWNQRHYVLKHAADLADETLVGREVDYALTIVARAPSQSAIQNSWCTRACA